MSISPRLARAVIMSATVCTTIAGCASSATAVKHRQAAASPTASHVASRAPSPTASHVASRAHSAIADGRLGWNGAVAWSVTPRAVYLSRNAGRDYQSLRLPSGVTPGAIRAMSATPDGHVWVAAGGPGRSIIVYRGNSSSQWTGSATLMPTWPPAIGAAANAPASTVTVTPGITSRQVTVTAQLQLSHVVSVPRVFASSNGGASFTQHATPLKSALNTQWSAEVFAGSGGVIVAGPRMNHVYYTTNSGSTWAPSVVAGLPAGADVSFGTPIFVSQDVYLPATLGTGTAFVLLHSHDDGATFAADGAATLTFPGSPSGPVTPLAFGGSTWWLTTSAGQAIYRSGDNGHSWQRTDAPTLPSGVVQLSAAGATDATATIQMNTCANAKTDCSSTTVFETTSDAGRSWTRQ